MAVGGAGQPAGHAGDGTQAQGRVRQRQIEAAAATVVRRRWFRCRLAPW